MTQVLHTARISNAQVPIGDKERWTHIFSLFHARDKLNIPSFLIIINDR